MKKEVISKKRVRFKAMNTTSAAPPDEKAKQVKREGTGNLIKLAEPVAVPELNIDLKKEKHADDSAKKKREDEKIEINFKDFEKADTNHEAISPSFLEKVKKTERSRIPVLCRLFTSFETAIEKLMTKYLNVGGLAAHRAIQSYCLAQISDNPQAASDAQNNKLTNVMSWLNQKLQQLSRKSRPGDGNGDDQNLTFYPDKLKIVIVSPDSDNIKEIETVNSIETGEEEIPEVAMEDMQNELWEELNEAKNEDLDEEILERTKKKRSCFGFECLNEEEKGPKVLAASDPLNNLNQLSIAIKEYDRSGNHLAMGEVASNDLNIQPIENPVPEWNKRRKSEKTAENYRYNLRDKKIMGESHRPHEMPKKAKNLEKPKDKSFFDNLTDFQSYDSTTIYFCVCSVIAVVILLILVIYFRRRKSKGYSSTYDKLWYRNRSDPCGEFSDVEESRSSRPQPRRSRPSSLKFKGDRKSRRQSYLDDFRPVGNYPNEKNKRERMQMIQSENESQDESDYDMGRKYRSSGMVTK